MSEENVEIVRRLYHAATQGDDAVAFELYADDIEWDVRGAWPGRAPSDLSRVYRGHEGVRRFWRDYLSAFERYDFTVEELVNAGNHVLAVVREHAAGRLSQVVLHNAVYALWTVRDGKLARMRLFPSREEALADAGLRE
jgi:ketosteroid isomerase-like protein